MGFRDDEHPAVKDSNEYRIFVLGCSNTVGWGVPFDSVFTTLLENKLNSANQKKRFNVINGGIGNYNTTFEALLLKEKLPLVKPDKVILHYYINDVEIIPCKKIGFFVENSYIISYLENKFKYDKFKSNYSNIGEYYMSLYNDASTGWIEAQKAILEIKNLCGNSNIEFMVLLQPDLHDLSAGSDQDKCHDIIKGFLKTNDIEYLDLINAYRNKYGNNPGKLWVSEDDAHPNSLGHRVIFESLYRYLRKNS